MGNKILKVLVGIFLVASPVSADIESVQPRSFKAIVVCAHAVDCKRAERVFDDATQYIYKAIPITFKKIDIVSIPQDMSGDPIERMNKWLLTTQNLSLQLGADFVFVSLSPFPSSINQIDFDTEQVVGMASGIGVLGSQPALCWAKIIGSDKVAARIAAHEIGHLLGAWHTEVGLMAPTVGAIQYSDEFSIDSIYQIKEYLNSLP